MARVFVIRDDGSRNISSALKWGKIIPLANADFPCFGGGGRLISHIANLLYDFTEEDYILLIGDPILIGITFLYAAKAIGVGIITCLKWDRQSGSYFKVKVPVNYKEEDTGQDKQDK